MSSEVEGNFCSKCQDKFYQSVKQQTMCIVCCTKNGIKFSKLPTHIKMRCFECQLDFYRTKDSDVTENKCNACRLFPNVSFK